MWEQRHGFPTPERTAAGYRRYTPDDVETLRRVQAYRDRGLSVAAAIDRARETGGPSDRPSLYAAVAAGEHGARPQVLRKATLEALSRAIEPETLALAAAPGRPRGRGRRVRRLPRPAPPGRRPRGGADRPRRRPRQRVGGRRGRTRLRRLPARVGAACRRCARGAGRPRPALRGHLDA